jgi:glycosyltransferase involved in cell wall biosynthesis
MAVTYASPPQGAGAECEAMVQQRRLFLMLNSFETGGSERQFVSLAKSLDLHRFQLNIGCIQTKGALRELFGDVPRFKLGGSVYGWRSWHSRWRLSRHLRRLGIQIAHAFDFYTNLTLVPAAAGARVPVIVGSQRQLGDLLSTAQRRLQRAAFNLCDAVVCNSRAAAERLVSEGTPGSKIRVIGNALAAEAFANTEPVLPKRLGTLRVGMIARMNTESKNHRFFLAAAAKVAHQFSKVEFLLAGDGPLRAQLEAEAAALGISDRTMFVGDRRDIPAVMAALDLSVNPSDSESLSNVILESMAAGVPVIASNVGGNPELVNPERGMLVPARDAEALAAGITQLLGNQERREQLGSNSRQFAIQNFSLESITRQYEELYEELLRRKAPDSRVNRSVSTARTRAAIVGPSLNYVGGQSVQVDLLLRHWSGDPDVEAGFIPVDPHFPPSLRWIQKVPGLRTVVRTPFYFAALWRGLGNTEIAHIFSASYSSFLIAPVPAWLIAQLRGKKTIVHYHSGEARDHLRKSRIARFVLARVDRIITPSAYLVDVFLEFELSAEPIPNIIDFSQFRFRERRPLRPHFVCTRGFHPYYCVDVVVQAFAVIQEAFPEAVLDLVGQGPLEAEIRELVSQLKLKNVNFCGVASRDEIGKYYDRADIFLNASRLDNMPVSVLEAHASGTPVITTEPEGMRYLVKPGRTGMLSPVGDAHALAANAMRVLKDESLATTLIAGGFEQIGQYKWEIVREQWLRAYQSVKDSRSKS